MQDNQLVTVLINVRNCKKYIIQSVGSILDQTYTNLEIIVVDDGSTDGTSEILEQISLQQPKLRFIRREVMGIPAALNLGLAEAKGELIAKMDSDDISYPHRIERQVEEFKKDPDLVLLGSEVELITKDAIKLGPRGHLYDHQGIRRQLLLGNGGALTHPAVMYRKDTALEAGGYDERFTTTQDLDLFLRLSELGQVRNLPETLLEWRQHSDSVNRTQSTSWAAMKQLAIKKTLERIGLDRYLEEVFDVSIPFNFPSSSYELANFALRNGRRDSAEYYFKEARKTGEQRALATESLVELFILSTWWKVRELARKLRAL